MGDKLLYFPLRAHTAAMSVPRKPAFDEAGLWIRKQGRQLAVSTGQVDSGDRPFPDPESESGGGTRQKITQFSERSRRNLRRWIHSLRRDEPSLFITLTYHERNPSPREAKEHLDAFLESLHEAYPGTSSIWKMEPQKRGVPHFHILVFGCEYIGLSWLLRRWHNITCETSEAHRLSGVDIERGVLEDDGKLAGYLSKYLGKVIEDCEWDDPGRFWGIRRRENLPVAKWERVCTMSRADAERIIFELLGDWDVDLPEYVSVPSLIVNCYGSPAKRISDLP